MSAAAPAPPVLRRRVLLLLLIGISAVGQLTFAAMPPVLPELAAALRVSRGAIGVAQGIVALPGILLAGYLGYLLDRFGRRRVVRASLLIFGTAGAACFFAGNYWLMLGLRLVQGLGASTLLSFGVVLVGDQFIGHSRRWAMGINAAALTLAGTLWPILSGLVGAGGSLRPFLLYLLAFPVWLAARLVPEPAHEPSPQRPLAHLGDALRDLRAKGRLADYLGILPLSLITLSVYLGLTQTLTPLFLESEYGLTTTARGLLIALAAGASSITSMLSSRASTIARPARLIGAGLALQVVGFVAIGVAPALAVVGIGLAVVGGGQGLLTPLLQHFTTSVGRDRYRGVLVGTWVSANRVGMFVGPSGTAALAAGIGERPSYLAGAAIVVLVAVFWLPFRRLAGRRLRAGIPPVS
ncbi:MAG: MFS transporter [Acidimicrobiia bacterium]|nr:MFS transporter [Acidimicrobiia bacterium]